MVRERTSQPLESALAERVKELTCLFGISRLMQQPDLPLPQLLQGIAELLPPAWQYPEHACCRISLDGESFTSHGFQESPRVLRIAIQVRGAARGALEVFYGGGVPAVDPFLPEEWNLLEGAAQEVARALERRELEKEREHLLEQVRHMDRLATVGQFASGLAHELNEPLCSILGLAQLAVRDQEISPQAQEDLRKIIESSLHAREIVKGFLAFSRAGKSEKARVDLNPLIAEVMDLFKARCAREKVALRLDLHPDLPRLLAVPSQLRQVLVNLAVNAIQAMPGGGSLRLETRALDGMVRIAVEDTGIGMDEATLQRIFTPFFTTKEPGDGTGLGLCIVQGLVAAHGGHLSVESRPGAGTRFVVALPAA